MRALKDDAADGLGAVTLTGSCQDHFGYGLLAELALAAGFEIDGLGEAVLFMQVGRVGRRVHQVSHVVQRAAQMPLAAAGQQLVADAGAATQAEKGMCLRGGGRRYRQNRTGINDCAGKGRFENAVVALSQVKQTKRLRHVTSMVKSAPLP